MAAIHLAYGTAQTGTGGITSLATSPTWLAGYEWFIIDNSTELALDFYVSGKITGGTTPTTGTEIRLYLVGSYDGTTWPDVFDGTPSAETVATAGILNGYAKLAAALQIDAATSNVGYPYDFSVAQFFGGIVPKKVAVFVAHNCVAALNSTAGNHTYAAQPVYATSA